MNFDPKHLRHCLMIGLAALVSLATAAQGARQFVLAHTPAAARLAGQPIGTLAATQRLSLAITLPLRNRAALSNLLRQINDPASPNYHHYLTRDQFTRRFGPSEQDYNTLKKFAAANGLRVQAEPANRMLLEVSGTVADIQRTFHTTLGVYRHPTEARTFFAPMTEPSLDLSVPVLSVGGLDNYALARPRLQSAVLVSTNAVPRAGSGPNGEYEGYDFRAAYVPDTTLTGAGQSVGLVQFDGYTASDINYYETNAGLPNVVLTNVLLEGATGQPSGNGGEMEVSLDIEMAISMAPGLDQVIVYMAPNPSPYEIILNQMAGDDTAKQLSCSWFIQGGASNAATDQIFQEMAAQGQSFFDASGDNDAFTGLIDFPSDSPYITQVGGTQLTTASPGGPRTAETVWNRENGKGSGGGISTQYPIPDWQTNIDMSANQGSTTMRNVPDVAMVAEDIYVRVNGEDHRVGGTSCAAPLWAGFTALVNQEAVAWGHPTVGFINPMLDKIASGPNYNACFFDITNGNNTSSGSPSQFFATPGYDLCTGWGTPNGQRLIDALAIPEALQILPAAGFSSEGGVGGPFTVTSQTLSLTNVDTNSVTWTLASTSAWLDVSPPGGTLNPGDAATLVTVSLNAAASHLAVGVYDAAIWFTNLDDQASFERDYSLTILAPPSITTAPTNQAVLDGATASFSVTAAGGMPLFFQWQFDGTNLTDGGNISGSMGTNLVITNVGPADVGPYTIVLTNLAGSITSSVAQLTIVDSEPVITVEPTNEAVIAGDTATFTVGAVGAKPFYYQWSYGGLDGTNIDGATNAALTIPNVQLSDAGQYSMTISNSIGATTSSSATLSVILVPVITNFSPSSGSAGTNVTITGSNFSPVAGSNIVYFGAVRGTVVSASATNLLVTAPTNATFSPITVTVNGLIASAAQPFVPEFSGIGQIDGSTLGAAVTLNPGNGPELVVIADLNGDGKPDLVTADASSTVSIYQNISTNGTITTNSFAPPISLGLLSSNSTTPYSLVVADLDGDGKPDIIALDSEDNQVSVFRNISSGQTITASSFAARQDFSGGTEMRGLAVGDLNHDGRLEIVSANSGDNTVSVFENQSSPGNIVFAARVDLDAASNPFGVAVADIDGDGNPDLISANSGDSSAAISIFPNPGISGVISNQSFGARIDFGGNSAPQALAIGDLDEDDRLDIVVGSPNGQTISVYHNASTPGVLDNGSLEAAVDFNAGAMVNWIALADMDGDGRLDVAMTAQGANIFSIFKNTSAPGSFTSDSLAQRADFPMNSYPDGLALGDLDGDGRPDVVFGDLYNGTLSIYPNTTAPEGSPVITSQPTNVTVLQTSTATFNVVVSGNAPLFYQWHFNQTNDIPGATNDTLVITNAQFSDAGFYSVTVTNVLGATTSSNALLTVTGVDHFAWSAILSPRFVNAAFAVTVLAQDATNGTFTNFTGMVPISSMMDLPITPLAGNFVDGVWSGTITVSQAVSNLVLEADDGYGHVGFANAIDVVELPSLGTLNFGTSLTIFWPVAPSNFVLESCGDLSSGEWAPVTNATVPFMGQNLESVPVTDTNQFFRLHYLGP